MPAIAQIAMAVDPDNDVAFVAQDRSTFEAHCIGMDLPPETFVPEPDEFYNPHCTTCTNMKNLGQNEGDLSENERAVTQEILFGQGRRSDPVPPSSTSENDSNANADSQSQSDNTAFSEEQLRTKYPERRDKSRNKLCVTAKVSILSMLLIRLLFAPQYL